MTVEDLHDAITLLPVDLVAEADRRRSRKAPVIVWHRWAAMAACLILVLSCSLLTQSWRAGQSKSSVMMMDAAPAAAEAAPADAPQVALGQAAPQTAGQADSETTRSSPALDQGSFAPGILNVTWVEMTGDQPLETSVFLADSTGSLESYLSSCDAENEAVLRESTTQYDEAWFASQDLVLIRLSCPSDTTVESIQEFDGQWHVNLQPSRLSLLGHYHILMDVEKGSMESADQVTISYTEPYTDIQ